MFRTVLTPVQDLDAVKPVWVALLGEPTTDSPYYVGWTVDGQEVGLVPGGDRQGLVGPTPYWHVDDIAATSSPRAAPSSRRPRTSGAAGWSPSWPTPRTTWSASSRTPEPRVGRSGSAGGAVVVRGLLVEQPAEFGDEPLRLLDVG
jgi:hypothetical protein